MIEIRRCPRIRCMAILATVAGGNVARIFAGSDRAVMAA